MPKTRLLVLALLTFMSGIALVFVSPSAAQAHAIVTSTTPAADQIVSTPPEQVVVEFNESVSVVAAETGVIGPHGKLVHVEPVTADGNVVTIALGDDMPNGTYLVSYRVISADGHPVPGGFSFSVGERTQAPDKSALDREVDPLVGVLVVANRSIGYAGLALVLGPGLLLFAARARNTDFPPPRGPRRLLTTGLGLLAATSGLGLYLQVPYMAGGSLFSITGDDVAMVLESRFGGSSFLRLLVIVAALPLLSWLTTAADNIRTRVLPALLGIILAVTWPLSGHATTSAAPPLTMATDTIHVAAMGMWLGGLVTLCVYLVKRSHGRGVRELLPVWSSWATWLVAALAVAGVAQALIEIGSLPALLETTYGRLVIIKVGLFAVVLAVAYFARRAAADGSSSVLTRIRRIVVVELTVGAVILGVSAVLVQTVPAKVAITQAEVPEAGDLYSVELVDDLYTLLFELEPARVGDNIAHMYLFTAEGEPLEALEWGATYGQPDGGMAPIDIGLFMLSPNHAEGDVALPSAGEWEFTFTIRVGELDRSTVSTVVTVG
ncbi:MAG TPA: copper resistance protein CopC/CopD [Candidatus Stackebrandtia excrementipullorum]|nr:copper resistance protein CopC/CopD [Candidatus Stackebrandtia excrementipullorum]